MIDPQDPTYLENIKKDAIVTILVKENGDFRQIEGVITKIISPMSHHFNGIKVKIKIDNGSKVVGRVLRIHSNLTELEYLETLKIQFKEDLKLYESKRLEFKGSFLCDLDKLDEDGTVDFSDVVEFGIAKSIAAFANAFGGIVYIGVEDNQKTGTRDILGLKNDHCLLKLRNKNNPEFPYNLRNSVNKFLEQSEYSECVSETNILDMENNKEVCRIKVRRSSKPVVLVKEIKNELEFKDGKTTTSWERGKLNLNKILIRLNSGGNSVITGKQRIFHVRLDDSSEDKTCDEFYEYWRDHITSNN